MEEPARWLAGPLPAALADEVALLLIAEGISPLLSPGGEGTQVAVAARDHARAVRILAEEYPAGVDAEDARRKASARQKAPTDRWFGRSSWILAPVIAICVAIFIGEEHAGGSQTRTVLLDFGASRPSHVRAGEWWRLITAMFVHIGARHLLTNIVTLLVLGPALAAALGAGRFVLVYVLAGAAGNAISYLVAPSDVVSAGASGAILGVLGALGGQRIRFAASARYRGWQVIAALIAYLAIAVGAAPGSDNIAHLGGLAAGLILGLIVPPPLADTTLRNRLTSFACGLAACMIVLAAFAAHLALS